MDVYEYERKINAYMATREKLDVKTVYDRLKDTYDLVLTNTFALENDQGPFSENFEVLYGEISVGRFQLYDNGLYIVFDVHFANGSHMHWHPQDLDEAIRDVSEFMQDPCRDPQK